MIKYLIRWLSDVSGVTSDIRSTTFIEIGSTMKWNSYWFSGHPKVMNVLKMYGESLQTLRHNVVDISSIRDEYQRKDNDRNKINVDLEK